MAREAMSPVRVNPVLCHPSERRMSLSGQWQFRLDPDDRGVQERWFENPEAMGDTIEVPGSWQGQGFGGKGKDKVWDFQLEARTFRATYTGTGWYGRRFRLPHGWQGPRAWVNFGGAHPSAEVWLNGVRLGEHHAPFAPFGFEITDLVAHEGENYLAVRVHEQARLLGLAFNWQGNWSGLYRAVELRATGQHFLERFWVHPDVDGSRLRIGARVGGPVPAHGTLLLTVGAQALGNQGAAEVAQVQVMEREVHLDLPVRSPLLWSPDAPNLYTVSAQLEQGEETLDAVMERVGFLKLATEGKHFLINGEPHYMRGSGDFLSNPETGCPDTDRDRWRRKLRTLRAYGYNYVRCQSFVPAPEYFDAADEVGLLVQSEMGTLGAWGGMSPWHTYAWPQPTPEHREALKQQWDCVVMRDVNHPSANLYCMSNELGGKTDFARLAWQCYRDTKAIKPSAFVIWTDGGFSEELPGDFVNAEAEVDEKCAQPVIQHEFRWWSSFPDVRIMGKYCGAVRPYAAEIASEAAARHGISHVLPLGAANSQRLQLLEAKGKMEMCRRDHSRLAGICHFNAMDANPSPQGVIDEFYEAKCTDAATWRQTNGDTVVLASLGFDDRVLSAGDTFQCRLFVSDFSHPVLREPELEWRLVAGGGTVAQGRIAYAHQAFWTCEAGELTAKVPEVAGPVAASLEATLREGQRVVTNEWRLWLFPEEAALPDSVALYGEPEHTWLKGLTQMARASARDLAGHTVGAVLTERLDQAVIDFARRGGRVILVASEGLVRPYRPKFGMTLGHYFFTPPANYPPYEDGHDGTIISDHAMLGDLPHEGFADLHFFRMITNAPPLDLEPLGLNTGDPVMRVIHSYPVCRPLAYLMECALGRGGLILSALNLDQSLPEARYLLAQICRYAIGEAFAPAVSIHDEALRRVAEATMLP